MLKAIDLIPKDTERLSFRQLNMDDSKAWVDFVLSNEAMKFFTFPRVKSEADIWIKRQLKRYEDDNGGMMAVLDKNSGQFLGQCGLLWQELEGEKVLEVGYSFLPAHWNKGYASEAAAAFYKLGFELKMSDFILSVIHIDNISSQRVAEKNGLYMWRKTIWKELPVQVWRTDGLT